MTAPPTVATQVYRALVCLYPPAFRRQFSCEMACDFRDATSEAWQDGGWLAVTLLWIHICRDLVRTVAAQWFRNGPSMVLVLSAVSAAICGFAITQTVRRPFQPVSLSPMIDQDKAMLLFLATMVILLAVIVILFTVCFWLLVPKRRGRARRV